MFTVFIRLFSEVVLPMLETNVFLFLLTIDSCLSYLIYFTFIVYFFSYFHLFPLTWTSLHRVFFLTPVIYFCLLFRYYFHLLSLVCVSPVFFITSFE